MRHSLLLSALAAPLLVALAHAGTPVITAASLERSGSTHTVSVTLRHADTGWEHYADGWSVRLPDGTELGYRVLHHPHVHEQPFTRALGGLTIPTGTEKLVLVPHDSVHGWGTPFEILLPD